MGLFDQFPYTNFHELNLDWILNALKVLEHTIDQFVAINALKYADPIQWNIVKQYEKNTIVIDPLTGTAYISVQPVPSGVSLTNADYWTVVFDLGAFVTRAAKNFTDNWEADTTTTATFSSAAGSWLVWGDTLYKALVNIIAGDAYVVDSNIEHITMEDIIGHLETLNTTDKSNLVAAINEVLTTLINTVGDLADLNTTDQSNLVAAINENVNNILTLPDTFSYLVAQVRLDCVNGDDTNSGLTNDAPMRTIDAALKKYGRYGYINLWFMEAGDYDVSEIYVVGHSTCFQNYSGGVVNIGSTHPLFYIGGHVEIQGVTFKCRFEIRDASVRVGYNGGIPGLPNGAYIDGILDLTNCAVHIYECEFSNTLYITGCKVYFNNTTFKDGTNISANYSTIDFNTITIQNSTQTRFLSAYNGCKVVFNFNPDTTGVNTNYTNSLWLSNSELICSRDCFTAFNNIGAIHSNGGYINYDGYPQQINYCKRPVMAMGSGDDLNNYIHGGSYQCPNSTTAASLTNSPISDRAFNLYVLEATDPVIEQVITVLNTSVGNTMYRRRRSSSNIWGPWEVYLASELAPASNQITSGNDLNNFMTAGVYNCQNSTIAATLLNSPVTDRTFKLTVNQVSSEIIYQEIIVNSSTYTKYVRARSSGGTWGAWATINNTLV